MKKRIVSLLLCGVMVFSLAGCGGSGSGGSGGGADDVTLTMWTHQNEPWYDAYTRAIEGFEAEHEGVHIEIETFPYDEFEAKVQTSLIDGEGGADIYEMWGGWALDFAPYGTLMEIPEDFASQVMEETYAPTYGALLHEDKLYGIPLEFNIENGGMLVNLSLLEEAGLDIPTTWEELKEAAIAGTVHNGDTFEVKGFDFVNWDSVPYTFFSMILSQGAAYMTEDGSAFNVTTEEAKKAFDELASMVTEDGVTNLEGLTGGADLEGYQQLYAGRVMMCPRGPWTVSEGEQSFELERGKDFDYVAMPWYTDTPKFAAENGWSMSISASADSEKQELALEFLKYLYQDDVMLDLNVSCTMIPAKKSLAQSEEYLEQMPYAEVLTGILEDGQFIGPFNTDRWKEAVNNTFVAYCSGDYASVDEAMEALNTELNGILK